jgi:S1-C subfamily serine protease
MGAIVVLLLGMVGRLAGEPAAGVLEAQSQRIAVIDRVKDCVLAVFPASGQGGGSGVVISPDGFALTNFHVVLPCGKAMQCGMADGRVYDAVIVSVDPTGDIALIKLFGREDFPAAELGNSDDARPGQWVFALGNPFLLATDMQPTVTYGIISGVHRYQFPAGTLLEYADCLQIDASINPGNSGGPLFDARGRLIGINGRASFEKRGRVNVGAAYAISINQIKNFLGALHSGQIVDHATLGARVATDADGRVVVTDILESSDAFRRGLRYDDEIIRFGQRPISTPNDLKNVLGIFPKGWRVPLSYRRDGRRHDILVRLAGVHGQAELIEKAAGRQTLERLPMPIPTPKPDEDPEKPRGREKAKNKPSKTPKDKILPPAHRQLPQEEQFPTPPVVAQHFAEKRGFANYYFNTVEQQRVWRAWSDRIRPAAAGAAWALAGQSQRGVAFQLEITDTSATLKVPNLQTTWRADEDGSAALLPEHSGGLLPALYLWRRLAVEGLGQFGEVYYHGTAPLCGHEGLVDVLVGLHQGVEGRFYFDAIEGHLLALELFADDQSDPCEVYFSSYRERQGRFWPDQIAIRYGDEPFATFQVTEAKTREQGKTTK